MTQPCKFGRSCHRPDCYFSHPEGRDIDGQAAGAPTSAPAAPVAGAAFRAPGSAPPCKFDFACTRPDCYFFHPSGRAIDAGQGPPRHTTPPPVTGINLPDSPFGHHDEEAEIEEMLEAQEAQEAKDTWYPQHRNCNCCKGYIHACASPMCAELGVCGCTLEDSDIQAAGDAEEEAR